MATFEIDDLIVYLRATSDDSWCVDLCRTSDRTQHCVLSHVLNFAGVYGLDWFEEHWATMSMIFPVNDGEHARYQQPTPKARCLAFLENLRDRKEKCSAAYLADGRAAGPAPDEFWRNGTSYAYFLVRRSPNEGA